MMNSKILPLSDIEIFIAIVESASISAAARRLRLSQPTVSKKLIQLETLFGLQLFSRSTRHLSLSEAGDEVYRSFKSIMAEWDEVTDRLSGVSKELRGTLRIHSTLRIGEQFIAPVVTEFMQQNPALTIHLSLSAGLVNIIEEGFDLEIRTGPTSDEQDSKSLMHRNLGLVRFEICASPEYLRKHGAPKTPAELINHNCMIHTSQRGARDWPFADSNEIYYVKVNGRLYSNNQAAVYEALLGGQGIARMPNYAIRNHLRTGKLRALFPELIPLDTHLRAFYPRSRTIPRKAKAFLDFLEARVKTSIVDK